MKTVITLPNGTIYLKPSSPVFVLPLLPKCVLVEHSKDLYIGSYAVYSEGDVVVHPIYESSLKAQALNIFKTMYPDLQDKQLHVLLEEGYEKSI